jgi:hypothetical protein
MRQPIQEQLITGTHLKFKRSIVCQCIGYIGTCVKRGPFVQTLFPLWLPFKPSPRLLSILSRSLLGRDAVCVDLALALVDRNFICRRTGYLLLKFLCVCQHIHPN